MARQNPVRNPYEPSNYWNNARDASDARKERIAKSIRLANGNEELRPGKYRKSPFPYIVALGILFVSFIWLGLFLSEIHVHTRLNEYRAKREALLDDEANDKYRKVTGNLFGGGTRDLLFLLGFILIPLIIAISSAITIFNSN